MKLLWKNPFTPEVQKVLRFGILVCGLHLGLASSADGATVYNCSSTGKKCVVRTQEGIIGDRVKILDEKARIVALGRMIKRRGAYAVVTVTNKTKMIRKGYPVIVEVENRNSNLQWAASFSNRE